MRFTQLKLTGFKSFVDPTELHIDAGLTGVIGPNGCGKSNLLEALRWVMGATSAKSLRGAGMEDVIFAGTDARASREHAEVRLWIDNTDKRAPAQFNDADSLEIQRRITRGKGSAYAINGEEVRAKDVQLLFADAGTGANSPALVRQGQISELINAKPENRRRVLEEAAGVSGLRARRREAQLRLNAAEANLMRLQEVVDDLDARHGALQRQARQASKYRELSQSIRAFEALLWLRRWREAGTALEAAQAALEETDAVAEKALIAAAVATRESESALSAVQPLREAEAEAAAALRFAERARDQLDRDLEKAAETIERLTTRSAELETAKVRETELHQEAEAALSRLRTSLSRLADEAAGDEEAQSRAEAALGDADKARGDAERELDAAGAASADIRARREGAKRDAEAAAKRLETLTGEAERARAALTQFESETAPELAPLEAEVTSASQAVEQQARALETAEADLTTARETAEAAREARGAAEAALTAHDAERASLSRLLDAGAVEDQALDAVRAEAGFELALAAALGEDLEASLKPDAPRRWAGADLPQPKLPDGALRLSDYVRAPDVLAARLAAIGVVEAASDLEALAAQLAPGQRLVSRNGDLVRWDGFTALAGAPSPAAARLESRNRLADLDAARDGLQQLLDKVKTADAQALERREALSAKAAQIRDALSRAERHRRACETALAEARAAAARAEARRSGLADACDRAEARLSAGKSDLEAAQAALSDAQSGDDGAARLDKARAWAERTRTRAADARAALETVRRDAQGRRHRASALEREQNDWQRRESAAKARVDIIEADRTACLQALEEAQRQPADLEAQRPDLLDALSEAEVRARDAREAVAEGETSQRDADSALRAAEKIAADAREARAGAHATLTAAQARVEETVARLHDATGESPETLAQRGGSSEFDALSTSELERRLDAARLTRERLGAVNLRADEESQELDTQRQHLKAERDDLTEAVARLRKAVDTLSREGRARLLEAFEVVDGHFQRLFATLFDGGRAELALTESDDPLEAGLEIYACPPGKKMDTMSLMSGGEQALTATALIFAVFLSNPAPVCVLDEVDAPLDDANVDRYCTLLEEMRALTETRFLVITHNPVTMSRMDRLFGVTMGERGVSQLVSVNLHGAEALLAAE